MSVIRCRTVEHDWDSFEIPASARLGVNTEIQSRYKVRVAASKAVEP